MTDLRLRHPARRGVTLVELLVVVGVMLILATITIPAMRPLTEGRRIREAARAINVYFGRARSRAIESGRPCGVMLERLERQPDACVVLRQAEVPPPYSGDLMGAKLWVRQRPDTPPLLLLSVHVGQLADNLVRRGDSVQLNNQGPWYTIVDYPEPSGSDLDFPVHPITQFIDFSGIPTGTSITDGDTDGWIDSHYLAIQLSSDGVAALPWSAPFVSLDPNAHSYPFQILRQPVASAGAPLQLSRGAVIDLAASGLDRQRPFQLVDPDAPDNPPLNPLPLPVPLDVTDPIQRPKSWPVFVMFSPTGSIDSVYQYRLSYDATGNVIGGAYGARRAVEPIHLLVGKWERIPQQPGLGSQTDDGLLNWRDATNLWLAINPQTGLVTVAELSTYYVDSTDGQLKDNYDSSLNLSVPATLYDSRRLARQAQISKGGR